jgi:hypothetical protein
MATMGDVEKFMLDAKRKEGETDTRLKAIEELLKKLDGKTDDIAKTMTLARGGWVALMAAIGLFCSVGGLFLGLWKIFFAKAGISNGV